MGTTFQKKLGTGAGRGRSSWQGKQRRRRFILVEDQTFALGLPGCVGDYGKGCPKYKSGKRKGLQREAQGMGRYVEHKTRLGRASKAVFLG